VSVFHRTSRLLLRPIWPEDWQGVLAGIADEQVVRNLASAPWPYREDNARAFVAAAPVPKFPRCLITRADSGAVIGCIGIDPIAGDPAAAELGYWIAREHWGQGYATEAGHAMIAMARVLGHTLLQAAHFSDNPASARVLAKLGFVPTGTIGPRFSCGRGETAMALDHALNLGAGEIEERRAA
jgi:RimJ/RimL family protein N-acetyltransferase